MTVEKETRANSLIPDASGERMVTCHVVMNLMTVNATGVELKK